MNWFLFQMIYTKHVHVLKLYYFISELKVDNGFYMHILYKFFTWPEIWHLTDEIRQDIEDAGSHLKPWYVASLL